MTDEFEYFSRIGRGGSNTPEGSTPESDKREMLGSHRRSYSTKGKQPAGRVRSTGKCEEKVKDDNEDEMRPRTNSMPSKNQLLRVRNFQTSSKGLENQGDTMKSSSHCSLVSSNSSDGLAHSDVDDSSVSQISNTQRILLLGGEGVGKTALTHQFLTSDDVSVDDYQGTSISFMFLIRIAPTLLHLWAYWHNITSETNFRLVSI